MQHRAEPLTISLIAAVAAFDLLTGAACASSPAPPPSESSREEIAAGQATVWLVAYTPEDPVAYLSLAVLHRRFGIDEFESMQSQYLAAIEGSEGRAQRRLRAFMRLLDPDAKVGAADLDSISEGIDQLTSRALNCQRYALPIDLELTLRKAISNGGYALTHAGLALQWIEENDCATPWTRRLQTMAIQEIAKLLETDLRVTDLELEAATFLYYTGSERLIPPGFVESVLETQLADGGWSADSVLDPDQGHWHPTSLALWLLLERSAPEPIPMIPQ